MNATRELLLACHPRQPTDLIERFTAGVERDAKGGLHFRYVVQGAIDRIELPARGAPRHTDLLWHHTCFEAFITTEDRPAYLECNFSPSTAWATYGFSRFRTGMKNIVPVESPRITLKTQKPVRTEPVEVRGASTSLSTGLRQAQAERKLDRSSPAHQSSTLVLEARVDLGEFTDRPLRIGLTAIIEDKTGKQSFWSLHHSRPYTNEKPEFHHRGGFILRLA